MPQITSKLLPLVGESNSDERQSYLLDMVTAMAQDSPIATTHSKGDEMNNAIDVMAVLDKAISVMYRDSYSSIPDDLSRARAAVAELIDTLRRSRALIEAQGAFIEEYRTCGKCPQPVAVRAVALLHERNVLMPNHYNEGRIDAALARVQGEQA